MNKGCLNKLGVSPQVPHIKNLQQRLPCTSLSSQQQATESGWNKQKTTGISKCQKDCADLLARNTLPIHPSTRAQSYQTISACQPTMWLLLTLYAPMLCSDRVQHKHAAAHTTTFFAPAQLRQLLARYYVSSARNDIQHTKNRVSMSSTCQDNTLAQALSKYMHAHPDAHRVCRRLAELRPKVASLQQLL